MQHHVHLKVAGPWNILCPTYTTKKSLPSTTCNITVSVGVSDGLGEMIFQTQMPAKQAFHADSKCQQKMDRQNFQDPYSSIYHRVNWTYGSPNRDLIFQALWYVTIWTAFPFLPYLESAGLYSQGPWQKGSTFPASGLMEWLQPLSRFLSPREQPLLLVVVPPNILWSGTGVLVAPLGAHKLWLNPLRMGPGKLLFLLDYKLFTIPR